MRHRIHILTTAGPVRIQSIGEEDPAVRSAICLDGKAVALPISAAYDAFVRAPTGVIERFTGHAAYRMDVSGPVEEGRSWQLPAFIAHAAVQAGTFVPAGAEADGDCDVYATGEIDRDWNVLGVGHVPEKLAALAAAAGKDGTVLVPGDSKGAGPGVDAVETVSAALRMLDLPEPVALPRTPPKPMRRGMAVVLVAVAVVVAILFGATAEFGRWNALLRNGRLLDLERSLADAGGGWDGWLAELYPRWLSLTRPSPGGARTEAVAEYAPTDGTCAEKSRRSAPTRYPGRRPCALSRSGSSPRPIRKPPAASASGRARRIRCVRRVPCAAAPIRTAVSGASIWTRRRRRAGVSG